jgi:type IV pilus assembly protein PilA
MISHKKLKEGFTLVELMIVVAIVGVLAVLAVYGVRKYIANAKTAEARNSLGQIGKDAVTAFEGEHMSAAIIPQGSATGIIRQMCQSASATVPSALTSVQAKKYQSSAADWAPAADVTAGTIGWPCLKFEMSQPQYYMYDYKANGQDSGDFSSTATGDLNGDSVASTFTMLGSIQSGRLTLAPTIGETSPEE